MGRVPRYGSRTEFVRIVPESDIDWNRVTRFRFHWIEYPMVSHRAIKKKVNTQFQLWVTPKLSMISNRALIYQATDRVIWVLGCFCRNLVPELSASYIQNRVLQNPTVPVKCDSTNIRVQAPDSIQQHLFIFISIHINTRGDW